MAKALKKKTSQSAALQYTYDRYIGNDAKRIQEYEEEVLNAEIARKVYDLRTSAGISQRELAKRVGTSASAICRLEASDYEGHSLYMLKRIAEALDRRIEIRFVPVRRKQLKDCLRSADRVVLAPGALHERRSSAEHQGRM
jgi:transcriptional regulator with XRE-family HTH domain